MGKNSFQARPTMILPLITALTLCMAVLVAAPAFAEVRFEDRSGVLYVTNVEPRQSSLTPPRPPRESPTPKSGDAFRHVIAQPAERSALAPKLVASVIRAESNF